MTTIELIQARINHAAVNSKPEVEDSLKELLQAVLKEMPLGCPSSGVAETPRTEENKYESVMAQLRRENQSYSHEIGILRKHRAYQPDGEPVFQHTFDELLARAEAAEAEVARLTKERDEALDVLKNYIPRNGSLVERAICILEGAAAKETP